MIRNIEVNDIIKEVISKIGKDPFIIHNERDIHSMLYENLREKYNKKFPINLSYKNEIVKDENGKMFTTGLVHCEYFFGKNRDGSHNRQRFDLVVFDKDSVKNINNNWLTKSSLDDYEIISLKHVFEVKCELGGGGSKNRKFSTSLAKKDVDRLIEFRKLQLKRRGVKPILHFVYVVRWITKSNRVRSEIMKILPNDR